MPLFWPRSLSWTYWWSKCAKECSWFWLPLSSLNLLFEHFGFICIALLVRGLMISLLLFSSAFMFFRHEHFHLLACKFIYIDPLKFSCYTHYWGLALWSCCLMRSHSEHYHRNIYYKFTGNVEYLMHICIIRF